MPIKKKITWQERISGGGTNPASLISVQNNTLYLNYEIESSQCLVDVCDQEGRILIKQVFTDSPLELDLSTIPNGTYSIWIMDGDILLKERFSF